MADNALDILLNQWELRQEQKEVIKALLEIEREQGKKDERERINNIIDYFIDKQIEIKTIIAIGHLKKELMKE